MFLTEFQLITREMQKYRQLKENLRSNFAQKQTNSRQPDIEQIKNQIRKEFRKKLATSSTDLTSILSEKIDERVTSRDLTA